MDKVRLGIIGLGWFGEIHGDAIAGIPEIAYLWTSTARPNVRFWLLADSFPTGNLCPLYPRKRTF